MLSNCPSSQSGNHETITMPLLSPQQRQKTQTNDSVVSQQQRLKVSNSQKKREIIPYQRGSQVFKPHQEPPTRGIEKQQVLVRPRTRSNLQEKIQVAQRGDLAELPNHNERLMRSWVDIRNLNYAKHSQIGRRQNQQSKKQNQDAIIDYKQAGFTLLGVCDGHGSYGHFVAEFVSQYLPKSVSSQAEKNQFMLQCDTKFYYTILKTAFLDCEEALRQSQINVMQSGSTATVALMAQQPKQNFLSGVSGGIELQTVVFVAWVGDSRAILVRNPGKNKKSGKDLQVISLTQDHRPDDPGEKERILNRGGRIEPYRDYKGLSMGPQRIWLPDMSGPGLAMSRSIGDRQAHSLGVVSEPSISHYMMTSSDCFMVIGSDGIWQYLSNEEVGRIVFQHYVENRVESAVESLIEKATEAWIKVKRQNNFGDRMISQLTISAA